MPSNNQTTKLIQVKANGFVFDGYSSGPENGPLVLCLHGFPQFADSWLKILPDIGAAGFHAVALNQRGYSTGAAPEKVSDYALPHLVDDVLAVATFFRADAFHLVGHDWGGVVGWKLAAAYPERLLSLNIVSTPHLDALREAMFKTLEQPLKSSYIALFKAPFHLAEKAISKDNWKLFRKVYLGKVEDRQIDLNIERFSQNGQLTKALNWYRASQLLDQLGLIRVRTLYIWGSHDQALGSHAAANTAKFVEAPYRFERIEGGSHWLPDEEPKLLSRLVVEHLKRVPRVD